MKVQLGPVSALLLAAAFAACSAESTEDYPEADEVPVVETPPAMNGAADTMLSPVVEPTEPGATPP